MDVAYGSCEESERNITQQPHGGRKRGRVKRIGGQEVAPFTKDLANLLRRGRR
jgi:hypothetical protein